MRRIEARPGRSAHQAASTASRPSWHHALPAAAARWLLQNDRRVAGVEKWRRRRPNLRRVKKHRVVSSVMARSEGEADMTFFHRDGEAEHCIRRLDGRNEATACIFAQTIEMSAMVKLRVQNRRARLRSNYGEAVKCGRAQLLHRHV